jgi:hypothetical protein
MAVPAITLDFPIAQRVGNRVCGLISGSANVTAYDTAHPAVAAITGLFKPSGKLPGVSGRCLVERICYSLGQRHELVQGVQFQRGGPGSLDGSS